MLYLSSLLLSMVRSRIWGWPVRVVLFHQLIQSSRKEKSECGGLSSMSSLEEIEASYPTAS